MPTLHWQNPVKTKHWQYHTHYPIIVFSKKTCIGGRGYNAANVVILRDNAVLFMLKGFKTFTKKESETYYR